MFSFEAKSVELEGLSEGLLFSRRIRVPVKLAANPGRKGDSLQWSAVFEKQKSQRLHVCLVVKLLFIFHVIMYNIYIYVIYVYIFIFIFHVANWWGKRGSPEKCHPADAKRRSAHPSGISLFGGHAHRTDDRSWGILMFTGAPQIVIFCCTSD